MVRRYGRKDKHAVRAQQIWQILISLAHNRELITYKKLADLIGFGGGGVLGKGPLDRIAYYCNQNDLPPLTPLVVNEKTGLPGNGIPVNKPATQREKVFNWDWYEIVPPTADQFEQAHLDAS
jgi:hypothetical protein